MGHPDDKYLIGGAGLPVSPTDKPFDRPYEPRWFQREALQWIYEDCTPPVGLLAAPTGAGKTDVIAALAAASTQVLCVYPTNALIDAQAEALTARGLAVDTVTGDTLSGTGTDRSEELLNRARRGQMGDRDVLITNPDILQAAIQNLYFSAGSRLLNIYTYFDTAVFDEFHYYDPLGASGLLTQIKILAERGAVLTREGRQPPDFLLSSATPAARFVEYIREDLSLPIRDIRSNVHGLDLAPQQEYQPANLIYDTAEEPTAEAQATTDQLQTADRLASAFNDGVEESPVSDVSRFRYPMFVRRHSERSDDAFDEIADRLVEVINQEYNGGAPIAAVIFNSAARSNEFQSYLRNERRDLAPDVAKDNGYDTNADTTVPDEIAALNTTSKGEVGLNYDIRYLAMDRPYTATQFIQRIGRAGRSSPAVVDIYNLADPGWPRIQSYPGFLTRVLSTLDDPQTRYDRLRSLAGMRSAHALHDRLTDDGVWHSEEVFADFSGFPTESRWRVFLEQLSEAQEELNDDSWTGITLSRPTSKVIRGACHAQRGLQSLRGRTVTHSVTYPQGDDRPRTEYDLVSALRHYAIGESASRHHSPLPLEAVSDLGPLRGYYPGDPNGGDGIHLRAGRASVERALEEGYLGLVEQADFSRLSLAATDLEQFFQQVPLAAATIPTRVRAGHFVIECDPETAEVTAVDRRS